MRKKGAASFKGAKAASELDTCDHQLELSSGLEDDTEGLFKAQTVNEVDAEEEQEEHEEGVFPRSCPSDAAHVSTPPPLLPPPPQGTRALDLLGALVDNSEEVGVDTRGGHGCAGTRALDHERLRHVALGGKGDNVVGIPVIKKYNINLM